MGFGPSVFLQIFFVWKGAFNMKNRLPVQAKVQPPAADRLAEERVIELAVKRLVKQKEATLLYYEDLGMARGKAYAARANYLHLRYVVESFWPFSEGFALPTLTFDDLVVGKVFRKAFAAYPFMAWRSEAMINWRTPPSKRYERINEFGEAFIFGFIDAVENFWNEVSKGIEAQENAAKIPIKYFFGNCT
jgi:hypothetical protein